MTIKKKILIAPSTFAQTDPVLLDALVQYGFEIIKNPFSRKLNTEELLSFLPGTHGIIAGLEMLDRAVLEHSDLKVISRCGAGISNVDLVAARELGIKVFYTPDAPTNAVAEMVVGGMISLVRNIPQMDRGLHNKQWIKKIGLQIGESTVAIIGFGRIGRRIAGLLTPFNCKILAVDSNLRGAVDGIKILSLEDALSRADIVTVHASGKEKILGDKEFALIKHGAFIINCARGGVVDEDELIKALDNGRIAGAWLDCFSTEPYTGPLTGYPQVLLTPHAASYTIECRKRMEKESVDNLIAGFRELEGEEI